MPQNNKKCVTCGKEYSYCPGCKRADIENMWKNIYCSENCRKIFRLMTDYCSGHVTKEEAKQVLLECDLSNKEHFKPSIAKRIDEIFAEDVVKVSPSLDVGTQENDILECDNSEKEVDQSNDGTEIADESVSENVGTDEISEYTEENSDEPVSSSLVIGLAMQDRKKQKYNKKRKRW